jgi:hypothetical protein
MINYNVKLVQYQIVSGINFQIEYLGYDSLTEVTALIHVNLNMEPYLLSFDVHCSSANISNMALPCTD